MGSASVWYLPRRLFSPSALAAWGQLERFNSYIDLWPRLPDRLRTRAFLLRLHDIRDRYAEQYRRECRRAGIRPKKARAGVAVYPRPLPF